MRVTRLAWLFASGAALYVAPANAAVTINISQVGPDVVAVTSGTLDLTGLTTYDTPALVAGINPSIAVFSTVYTNGPITTRYTGLSGPGSFGSGTIIPGTGTGDSFYLNGAAGVVGVYNGYVSGSALAATTVFAGNTFASLGLTPGTYVFTTAADRIIVNIGISQAVPEPAAWAMMLLGFGAIGLAIRSKRRLQPAT